MLYRTIRRSIVPGLLALALGTGAAGAQQCDAKNPKIEPVNGGYPSMPALPWTHSGWSPASTKWSINGSVINLNGIAAPLIQGVNYEPTQIGGSADFSPFNDFFYTNNVPPSGTWAPLWNRDVGALRTMGVNAIRTYGWWKWEPLVENNWQRLNFAPKNESNLPCFGSNYPHPTHLPFLDMLWNNGVNPIYVWIGISLPIQLVQNPTEALTQFYRYTARWAAIKYGNHPAVMGFVIGNEIDLSPSITQSSSFWLLLNDFHALVKASAPDKLTMSVFHDGDNPYQMISNGTYAGFSGPQVYKLDVFGDNPYNNPALPGNAVERYKNGFVNCTMPQQQPSCVKPMLFTEFGTPADTHQPSTDAKKVYPNLWTSANFIWNPSPPPPACLTAPPASPPGSGGDGPNAEFARKKTIATELSATPTNSGDPSYTMPMSLAQFFSASGIKQGDPLPAADQANWFFQFWTQGVVAVKQYVSGGFAFEWRDEWWKGNSHPYFQTISGNDTCTQCPCERGRDTGAANVVFPGGWGDEQWFGLAGAMVANKRDPMKPVNNQGMLNGGPDILKPRAAVVALCKAYGAC
jgi:hypothetical protein